MDKFYISQEKKDLVLLKIVKNQLPNLIRDLIFDYLEKGLSFSKIGAIFGLNKSTIFQIYKGQYFPKTKAKKNELLEKYLGLI